MGLIAYGLIALAILGSLGGLYYKVNHDGVVAGRAEVKSQWDAANDKAKKTADATNEENRIAKEKADAANAKTKRDLDGVYAAYRSLRDQRRVGSVLPAAPSGAASPATASFDRSALDRGMAEADGVLQRGAEKILLRGDQAIVDLNTAKEWAKGR